MNENDFNDYIIKHLKRIIENATTNRTKLEAISYLIDIERDRLRFGELKND